MITNLQKLNKIKRIIILLCKNKHQTKKIKNNKIYTIEKSPQLFLFKIHNLYLRLPLQLALFVIFLPLIERQSVKKIIKAINKKEKNKKASSKKIK